MQDSYAGVVGDDAAVAAAAVGVMMIRTDEMMSNLILNHHFDFDLKVYFC
jgi:hypothetical protein